MSDNRSVESWTWYGVATLVTVLRYVSRGIRLGSWRRWEVDDYVMLLAFGFYTNLIVWVNVQSQHRITNILPDSGTQGMSPAEISERVYGSKVTFVVEESMVMVQSLCKLCMCLFYFKLTSGLQSKRIWVNIVLAYVVLGWFITELFFFGIWCRPFHNYFRVFDNNNPQCTTAQHHLIMSYTFNISSDVLILIIPIPVLIQSQLPWKKKAILMSVFSLGIFVIISATLSRYYCFAKPESILWIFWYVREASTAIIVVNMPHLYALLRTIFHLEAFGTIVKRTKASVHERFSYFSNARTSRRESDNSYRTPGGSASTDVSMPEKSKALQIVQRTEFSVTSVDAAVDRWDYAAARTVIQGGHAVEKEVDG